MPEAFRYGLYGVGRIGRVHGQIVKAQGHSIVAVGDEVLAAAEEAARVLDEPGIPRVTDPDEMIAAADSMPSSSRRTPKIMRATLPRS